jgi:hypothetical protein
VAGNIYQLPFATGILDSLAMIRVMHHLADVPSALQQLSRVLHSQSVAVLEYANKRNLKAIARWLSGRQPWSPFQPEPIEFVELNFDFHPVWMKERFAESDFVIRKQWAVSHFRLSLLKNRVAAERLARWDQRLFEPGGQLPLAPSVFLQSGLSVRRERARIDTDLASVEKLFCCPLCTAEAFVLADSNRLTCQSCQSNFLNKDGIWDFKERV